MRYGTMARTPGAVRPSSSCLKCVCVHMYSFAGLIRRTPPPTFSDTAITDRHFDTTIFQLRAHWVRISWSIGSEKSFEHVPPVAVEPSTSCVNDEHPISTKPGAALAWGCTLLEFSVELLTVSHQNLLFFLSKI